MIIDTKTELSSIAATVSVEKPSSKIHLGYLDSLRALAALHVVMVHAMDQVDRNSLHSPSYVHWFRDRYCYGHHAVGLFIPLVVAGAYGFFLACERPFLNRRVVLNTK